MHRAADGHLISFGYDHGPAPKADIVIDVRPLSHALRFNRHAAQIRTRIAAALRTGKTVAVGCEHGQHRSVQLVKDVKRWMPHIHVDHRDVSRPVRRDPGRPILSRLNKQPV